MAKAATLNIDIVAKAESALEAFDKVKSKAGEGFNAMKVAAVAGATGVIGALTEATKAAGEHQANVARLEQAYKDAGISTKGMKGSLEEIEATSRKTGQSTEDNIEAYSHLVAATRDSEKANKELAIAQDLAAFKGISVKDAADAITKAAAGNTRALKDMGIATKDAGGHQIPTAELMKQLEEAVHGQAEAFGKTAPGEMARYHESLDQTKEKIGEALLPALQQVLNILQPVFAWLTNNTAVLQVLAPIIAVAAGAVVTITIAMKVWTAIQWALNIAMNANPIGLIILAIAALVGAVIYAYSHFAVFRDAVNWVWNALKAVGDWVLANWRIIVDVLLGPLGLVITNFATIKRVIEDVIGALARVGDAVSKALGWLGKLPSSAGGLLGKLNPFSLPPPGAPAAAPVIIQITATAGDSLPETVYWALKEYQRRHVRPELAPLFNRAG
jgi:hypothetical protein